MADTSGSDPQNPSSTNAETTTDGVPAPFGGRNPDPGPGFRAVFTSTLRKAIVAAVQRAYDIVQESHDPSLGYNAQTFGHTVYHVGCFQLGKVCESTPGLFARVEELRTLARFQSGEYTVGFYKVGNSETENIWEAFPTSENGATSATSDGQPILSGLEDAMVDKVDALRYAVVAHLGNSEDGLCAVYLCIPVKTEGGKIVRWGYAEEIYLTNRGVGTPGVAPAALPPEEQIEAPKPAEEPEGDVVVRPKDGG